MFPDGHTGKATKKMLLKHNLHIAQEMIILPGLHLALVSILKLVDAAYTIVLTKDGMAIYDDNTTAIAASNLPILDSNRCQHTGMWRLNLDLKNPNTHRPDKQHVNFEMINVIFNLPCSCKTCLWYHASAGFPPKETFIDTVCNGNYATWPKLTVTLINYCYLNSDKTVNKALKRPTPRHPINKAKSIGENYRKQHSQDQDQEQKITYPSHPTHQNPQKLSSA
jgi:hypothetical protein